MQSFLNSQRFIKMQTNFVRKTFKITQYGHTNQGLLNYES